MGRRAVGAVGALGWRVPAPAPGPARCRPRPDGAGGAGGTDRVSLFPFQVQVKLVSPWGSRPQSHHEGKASLNQLEWLSNSGSVEAVAVASLRVLQRQVCGVAWCGAFSRETEGQLVRTSTGCGVELWSQFGAISPKLCGSPIEQRLLHGNVRTNCPN